MYHEFFGLRQAPFKITPDTRLFFPGGSRGEILQALLYAIESGEGIIKVVGEVGSGKTMLCRMLEVRLSESIEIVYLPNPSLSPEDILHAIALELGLTVDPVASRIHVMQALHQRLLERHAANQRVVVFVEEAQAMPLATLEEIRLLSNLETQSDKLLQIVLFGQPELDRNLNVRHIRQLRERITHSFTLPPLSTEDTQQYVRFRMSAVGYRGPDVFDRAAYRAINDASQGLTRRVNILADKCLLAAFAENTHNVTKRHAAKAIADSEIRRRRSRRTPALAVAAGLAVAGLGLGWYVLQQGLVDPAAPGSSAIARLITITRPEQAPETAVQTVATAPSPVAEAISGPSVAESDTDTDAAPAQASSSSEAEAPVVSDTAVIASASASESDGGDSPAVSEAAVASASRDMRTESDAMQSDAAAPRTGRAPPEPTAVIASSAPPDAKPAPAELAAVEAAPAPVEPQPEAARPAPDPAVVDAEPASNEVPMAAASEPLPGSESVMLAASTEASASLAAVPWEERARNRSRLVEERLQAARQWLAEVDQEHFTIQLLATAVEQDDSLEEFLRGWARSGRIEKTYVFRTSVKGDPWFGVLYDVFPTVTAARNALERLPADIKRYKPFVRNVRDVSRTG